MTGQLGFADGWVSPKLGRNASLERLAVEVKWYRFAKLLARLRPDRFRNRLVEAGLAEKLFAEFEHQLDKQGLILKRGTMIDASLVETPLRPGSSDGTRAPVDPDAAMTARKGRRGTHYGYKVHVGADEGSRLIRRLD